MMNLIRQGVQSLFQVVKQRLRQWTKPDNHSLLINTALDLTRSKPELLLENILLRQQLIVLKRQAKRPALTWCDLTLPRVACLHTLNSHIGYHRREHNGGIVGR
jgi:hypothetical protein